MRRLVCVALAVMLAVVWQSPTASAAPPQQVSVADVLKALGIQREPTDYVMLVDVSLSMADNGKYDRAKQALTAMTKALQPKDRISLVALGKDAKVLYTGNSGDAALSKLPALATSDGTDIGLGIEAGLGILRSSSFKVAAIGLITDGLIDTAPGSGYATANAPGWDGLRAQADALAPRMEVAAYAIPLAAATDAGVLSKVFPQAQSVPGDQVASFLGSIGERLVVSRAVALLKPDLAAGVTATVNGIDPVLVSKTGKSTGTVTVTSGMKRIPMQVSGLAITGDSLGTVTAQLPDAVVLRPGESRPITVTVTASGAAKGGTLTLAGSLDSPWRDALTSFGLSLPALAPVSIVVPEAPPEAAPVPAATLPPPVVAPATAPLPWTQIAIVSAAAVLLAALVALLASRRPKLTGSLEVTDGERIVGEVLLDDRSSSLQTLFGSAIPALTGTVRPARRGGGVVLVAKLDGVQVRQQLGDQDSVAIGPLTVRYSSHRTRTLSRVVAERSDATDSGDLDA